MIQLTSKIQYDNFEQGEFIAEKQRSYEECIELVESFPWELQRKNIVISLTNPSVTIQGKCDDFLKLALFYNGKFVLYYLNNEQKLFSKSFFHIKDAYKYIKLFFDATNYDLSDFKKEPTLLQNNLKHFISQDFHYTLNKESAKKYLLSTSWISFVFTLLILLIFIFKSNSHLNILGLVTIIFLIFILGGGLNLILFFNYYSHARDKALIMSKGNDFFHFGPDGNLKEFNKAEIIQVIIEKLRSRKSVINDFAVITLELKDGTDIIIPNILIDDWELLKKLPGIPKLEKNKFPFIW